MSINPTGRSGSLNLNTNSTTTRQSTRSDFGNAVRQGLGNTANAVGGAVSTAAPMVPGGAVVSAAVNGALGGSSGATGSMGAQAGFAGAGDIPFGGPGLGSATGEIHRKLPARFDESDQRDARNDAKLQLAIPAAAGKNAVRKPLLQHRFERDEDQARHG